MSVFEAPQCLISTDPASGKLRLEDHVTVQLMSVNRPLHSVAITGLYRTGKSYLLTRVAEKSKGFPLGSSIQSKTKGIWAWCLDHPVREDEALLLLDTEGLGDIRKTDEGAEIPFYAYHHCNWSQQGLCLSGMEGAVRGQYIVNIKETYKGRLSIMKEAIKMY